MQTRLNAFISGAMLAVFLVVPWCVLRSATARDDSVNSFGQGPPNVILFLVDDMGWQDTSVSLGPVPTVWNHIYRTPNMRRLAARGMAFTQAYAAHPVCSPTRVSLMTGRNPARTHVTDWVGHGMYKNRYLESPRWNQNGWQPDRGWTTLPEVLRQNGYRTIHVGKAHFGGRGTPGGNPRSLGFDINIGGSHYGSPVGGWFSPWLGKHRLDYPGMQGRAQGEYLTDALTSEAIAAVGQAVREGKPFFLNMAHYAVHAPIRAAPARYVEPFRDGRPEVERAYASMVYAMDASLGRILDCLNDPDGDGDSADSVADRTLVWFTSDNGGLSNHTRSVAGAVTLADGTRVTYERDRHNLPLASGKGSAYEGGYRVPLLVAWAGQPIDTAPIRPELAIAPGSRCATPVHADDFFPTILSIVKINNPVPDSELDGIDVSPLLAGKPCVRNKSMVWHYPHQWYRDVGVGLGIEPFTAIRRGDDKLIYFYGDGIVDGMDHDPRWELYDVVADPGETNNRIADRPALAKDLRNELIDWMNRVGAQRPICRQTGNPVEWADLGNRPGK